MVRALASPGRIEANRACVGHFLTNHRRELPGREKLTRIPDICTPPLHRLTFDGAFGGVHPLPLDQSRTRNTRLGVNLAHVASERDVRREWMVGERVSSTSRRPGQRRGRTIPAAATARGCPANLAVGEL